MYNLHIYNNNYDNNSNNNNNNNNTDGIKKIIIIITVLGDDRETRFCFNAFLFCYFVSILFCCTTVLSWTTARNISLSILSSSFQFFPTLNF